MLQRTKLYRARILAAAALFLSLTAALFPAPAQAAATELLRVPTADVLPFGRVALEVGLPFETTVQRVTAGLPGGLQLSAAVPPGGTYAQGLTAELRYRFLEGSLLTPSVAVGAGYNTKTQEVSPYAVLTKGVLNAKLTAGVHLAELVSGAEQTPVFAGADLALLGPLHVLAEYDEGETRLGAKLSLLNAELKAYVQDSELNLTGRLVLPF